MCQPSVVGVVTSLWLLAWSASASATTLTVEIVGMTRSAGLVLAAVYDHGTDLADSTKAVRRAELAIADNLQTRWQVLDLPKGTYGIAAFHDLDGDGRLDTNLFGLPTEPYGFSNGARGLLGPPSFASIRFELGDAPLTVRIEVR